MSIVLLTKKHNKKGLAPFSESVAKAPLFTKGNKFPHMFSPRMGRFLTVNAT